MAEMIDENSSIESTTVGVYRTSTTTSGGRRFSFAALVVVETCVNVAVNVWLDVRRVHDAPRRSARPSRRTGILADDDGAVETAST